MITIALVLACASGCGPRSKEAIVEKARGVETRAELEKKLGRPDDLTKLGPVETWRYRASNGDVVFVVVGDKVTLQAAGGSERSR